MEGLLQQRADPNTVVPGVVDTALVAACREGFAHVTQLLIEGQADVAQGKADTSKASPLSVAAQNGHIEVARLLLDSGASPNQVTADDGRSPLLQASQDGHLEVARLLLDRGADPNSGKLDTGTTPLYMAAQDGHADIAQLLLERNADPNAPKTDTGSTPLYMASQEGCSAVVKVLLANGADPSLTTMGDGRGALFAAGQRGCVGVVLQLLLAGADPNQETTDMRATPLIATTHDGHLEAAQLLAVFGANVSHVVGAHADSGTAYLFASCLGHHGMAAWLDAVKDHSPVEVAAGSRMHEALNLALRLGLVDVAVPHNADAGALAPAATGSDGTKAPPHPPLLPDVSRMREASRIAATADLWPGMKPVCRDTQRLVRAAHTGWKPSTHWLHHSTFRAGVHAVLLVMERQFRLKQSRDGAVSVDSATLVHTAGARQCENEATVDLWLPAELWLLVCSKLLRCDWAVKTGL